MDYFISIYKSGKERIVRFFLPIQEYFKACLIKLSINEEEAFNRYANQVLKGIEKKSHKKPFSEILPDELKKIKVQNEQFRSYSLLNLDRELDMLDAAATRAVDVIGTISLDKWNNKGITNIRVKIGGRI